MSYFEWPAYVSVAERRQQAERKLAKLRKKGQSVAPVKIEGRTIANTFWGKSWCTNLERYSDFATRLPRGRSYVRNGSVLDLQIAKGEVAGNGRRFFALQDQDHHRTRCGDALEGHLSGLRGSDQLPGRTPARPPGQGHHGSRLSGGRRSCFRRPRKSSCPAAVRTGRTCANMLRRRSMALAPDSTKSRNFSLCCAAWMKMNCSPKPEKISL